MLLWKKPISLVVLYIHTNTYPQNLNYKAALQEKHFRTHTLPLSVVVCHQPTLAVIFT